MKRHAQTGAALVIGLILLSVLTILAASTMSTATIELAMSGNDQYRNRALLAAEGGAEKIIAAGALESIPRGTTITAALPNGDSYTTTVKPRGLTSAPVGYIPIFDADHFEIESTGLSAGGAKVTIVQGVFVVRPSAAPAPTPTTSSPAPLCLTGIEILPGLCVNAGMPVRTYWRHGSNPRE